jgi:hypothetical protein
LSLNHLYIGKPIDINIGNGKTTSAVVDCISMWLEDPTRPIFSNIELFGIPYTKLTPDNLKEFFNPKSNKKFQNALIIIDEISAIVPKNDRVLPTCKNHPVIGLCYLLAIFFRQVRKLDVDTFVTGQVLDDVFYQGRQLMNIRIYCELEHLEGTKWRKCMPQLEKHHRCPETHIHRVKQERYPSPIPWNPYTYCYPEKYYGCFNSKGLVEGWINASIEEESD